MDKSISFNLNYFSPPSIRTQKSPEYHRKFNCCSFFQISKNIIEIRFERDLQIGIIAQAVNWKFVDNIFIPCKLEIIRSSKVLSCCQQTQKCLPSLCYPSFLESRRCYFENTSDCFALWNNERDENIWKQFCFWMKSLELWLWHGISIDNYVININ